MIVLLFILLIVAVSWASYSLGERQGYENAHKDWENVIRTKDDIITRYQQTLDRYLR